MNGEPVPMGKTLGVISKLWEMTRRYTWVPRTTANRNHND